MSAKVITMKKKKNIGQRSLFETSRNHYEDYLPDLDLLSGTKKRMKLRLWYLLPVLLDDLIGLSSLCSNEFDYVTIRSPFTTFCQDRFSLVVYMYAMMIYIVPTYLWAIDNIPISDEVFVQTVQLFVSPFLVPVIMWTYLLHLFARELKVKDLGIADDPLFRD